MMSRIDIDIMEHRHEREMAEKDAEIAEKEAEIAEEKKVIADQEELLNRYKEKYGNLDDTK